MQPKSTKLSFLRLKSTSFVFAGCSPSRFINQADPPKRFFRLRLRSAHRHEIIDEPDQYPQRRACCRPGPVCSGRSHTPLPEFVDRLKRHLKGLANYFSYGYARGAWWEIDWFERSH